VENLTKKYRDVVDHNSCSGNDRKTCPFYDHLQEVIGDKPKVLASIKGVRGKHANEDSDTKKDTGMKSQAEQQEKMQRKKCKKPKKDDEVLSFQTAD